MQKTIEVPIIPKWFADKLENYRNSQPVYDTVAPPNAYQIIYDIKHQLTNQKQINYIITHLDECTIAILVDYEIESISV